MSQRREWGTHRSGESVEEEKVGGVRGVAEVGEAYADEAVFLIWIEGDSRKEREGVLSEFLAGGWSRRGSQASGEDGELRGLELEDNRAGFVGFFAGCGFVFFGLSVVFWFGFGV